MDADGAHPRRLTEGVDEYPRWSPDGKQIAYSGSAGASRDIWIIDSDGGHPHAVTSTLDEDMAPAWSPDGRFLAFERGYEPDRDIWVMRADGTDAHPIKHTPADETFPVWSSDGRQILYTAGRDLRLITQDGSHERSLGISGIMADSGAPPPCVTHRRAPRARR
jgi:Tol biopolymer transport system component